MIVYSLFAETLNRAPGLILSNVSYVKKIVFPLEILRVVAIGAALFHALISVLVLVLAFVLKNGSTMDHCFPAACTASSNCVDLGAAWGLASLGVFLRDVAQPIGLFLTVLLFASPVFYPNTALPDYIRPWLMLNPLTFVIEQARAVLIFGKTPYWTGVAP